MVSLGHFAMHYRDMVSRLHASADPSIETCRVALDMLERDYAGHGLPLTSLVIESSTLLLLVAFVVYFVIGRCKARRQQLRLFTSSPVSV